MSKDPAKFSVAELKAKLQERSRVTTGSKNELIARLMSADPSRSWTAVPEDPEDSQDENTDEGAVGKTGQQENAEEQESSQNRLRMEIEFMCRERELMQRELELTHREAELLRNSPRRSDSSTNARPSVHIKAISELLGEFNGIDFYFAEWEKQVRLLRRTYELDDNMTKLLMSSRLKGRALQWFHSKAEYLEMSMDQLLQEMQTAFDHRPMPVAEEDILEYVIDGIADPVLRNQARIQSFTSVSALLEAFKKISIQSDSKDDLKRETNSNKKLNSQASSKATSERLSDKDTQSGKVIRCFNCNKLGQSSKICREPKKEKGTCFRCGEAGHISKTCPKKEKKKEKGPEVNNIYKDPLVEDEFLKIVTFEVKNPMLHRVLCLDTLLDTGSAISIVKERFINNEVTKPVDNFVESFYGINRTKLNIRGKLTARVTLNGITQDNIVIYTVPENTMLTSAILGRDVLRAFGLALTTCQESDSIREIMNIDIDRSENDLTDSLIINPTIAVDAQQKLKRLFLETYVQPRRPAEPETRVELKLALKDNQPFHCTPRRLSYTEKGKLKIILDCLSNKGIIQSSTSEYASPIVIVTKKNGEPRMCVDYRVLNKVTARDNYPLPIIEDHLEALNNKSYFSTLDLKDGFYHISVAKESIKYTSFVTPLGQFEWVKMPFGLKTAPSTFQRFIDNIFSKLIRQGDVTVYMDDILVATETLVKFRSFM
ncbi:PREDICTED: uncharacterized protein LOC105557649 [Vollenhovia emeryi]|uniref:uncharacterized protein LOC105557649 n=1 Tax=Vollenhovia emeryi TaxID=411798 RepID=UPI0005F51F19|nr:PREDICTED: uncharacterized protein LOC105557649 [Vollenhovia emeryi]